MSNKYHEKTKEVWSKIMKTPNDVSRIEKKEIRTKHMAERAERNFHLYREQKRIEENMYRFDVSY